LFYSSLTINPCFPRAIKVHPRAIKVHPRAIKVHLRAIKVHLRAIKVHRPRAIKVHNNIYRYPYGEYRYKKIKKRKN